MADAVAGSEMLRLAVVRSLVDRAVPQLAAGQLATTGVAGRGRGLLGDPVGELELQLALVLGVVGESVAALALVSLISHALQCSRAHTRSFRYRGVPSGHAVNRSSSAWLPAAIVGSVAGRRGACLHAAPAPRPPRFRRCAPMGQRPRRAAQCMPLRV